MPNQRAKNVRRVTLTLDDELLRELEEECRRQGVDNRLEYIRAVLRDSVASDAKSEEKKKK